MKIVKKLLMILLSLFIIFNILTTQDVTYDIMIKNALIYDGVKNIPYNANIGIISKKIAYIGKETVDCKKLIDASGLVITPGFIDMQTHSDNVMMDKDISYESYLRQGVTTITTGNCGQSPLDLDYFISRVNPDINYIVFSGYNMLKIKTQKEPEQPASQRELELIVKKFKEEMELGSKGLSLGLAYYPVFNMDGYKKEIIHLLNSVKDYNPIIKAHIRSESSDLEESTREILDIAYISKCPIIISHIKTMGKENEGLSSKIISIIEYYQCLGVKIYCDLYPYLASSSYLATLIPDYFTIINNKNHDLNIKNESEIIDRIEKRGGSDKIIITNCKNDVYENKSLDIISNNLGLSLYDTVKKILEEDNKTIAIFFTINKIDMLRYLNLDYTGLGSDSTLSLLNHPRATGSFPLFINNLYNYFHDYNYNFGEMISKVTSKPAYYLNIEKRGSILLDYYADLIIFSRTDFKPTSNYENSNNYSKGIKYVILNGKVIIDDDKLINHNKGEFIK